MAEQVYIDVKVNGAKQSAAKIKDVEKSVKDLDKTTAQSSKSISASWDRIGRAAGAAAVATAAVQAATKLDALKTRLQVVESSAEAADNKFKSLRKTANELGVNFQVLLDSYTKFKAAADGGTLSQEQLNDVFMKFTRASAAMKLSALDTERVFRSLYQMASKGVVSMEELKNQLGDTLPKAMPLAAKAMNMTTQELIKQVEAGNVLAEELLPKLADAYEKEFGSKVAIAAKSVTAQLQRMVNAFVDIKEAVLSFLANTKIIDGFTKIIQVGTVVLDGFVMVGHQASGAFSNLSLKADESRRGLKGFKEETEEAKKATDEFRKSINKVFGSSGIDWTLNAKIGLTELRLEFSKSLDKLKSGWDKAWDRMSWSVKKHWLKTKIAIGIGGQGAEAELQIANDNLFAINTGANDKEYEYQSKHTKRLLEDQKKFGEQKAKIIKEQVATNLHAMEGPKRFDEMPLYGPKREEDFTKVTRLAKEAKEAITAAYREGLIPKELLADSYAGVDSWVKDVQALLAEGLGFEEAAKAASVSFDNNLSDMTKELKKNQEEWDEVGKKAFKELEDALVNMALTGKLSFKDMANSIIADLIRIAIRQRIVNPLAGFLGLTAHTGTTEVKHTGGFIGNLPSHHSGSLRQDERIAKLQVGEAVINRAGASRNKDAIAKMNAGQAVGGGAVQQTTAEINFNVQAIDSASFNNYLVGNRQTIENIINRSLTTNGSVRQTIKQTV